MVLISTLFFIHFLKGQLQSLPCQVTIQRRKETLNRKSHVVSAVSQVKRRAEVHSR